MSATTKERPSITIDDLMRVVDEIAAADEDGPTWMAKVGLEDEVLDFLAHQLEGSMSRAVIEGEIGGYDDLGSLLRATMMAAFQVGWETAIQYRSR